MFDLKKKQSGAFTLIELLVVVAIIGLLSSIILASLNTARAKSRDTKRKEDVIQLRTALETYYIDHGSYPLPYPTAWSGVYSGRCGTGNGTISGATAYITGLTPTYIPSLPVDPSSKADCTGYLYYSDGTSYKILIHDVWEEAYPSSGQLWYDPARPTWALMLCNGNINFCSTQ